MQLVPPILVAVVFALVCSFVREPARLRFNAILVAGAGAAYLNGGLGPWELVFTATATAVAYRGLSSYRWIGVAWAMHAGWDALHHARGLALLDMVPDSSFGCAITDSLLAAWFVAGAPDLVRRATSR